MLRVNSKKVTEGDTFLDLSEDENIGKLHINEAIEKGATCIITKRGNYDVKTILTNDPRKYLSNYLKELYEEKLKKIRIIGIVGTSGKTSTGIILNQMLNKLNSKSAFIGTNGFYLNDYVIKIGLSTPDIYNLYEYINRAVDEKCENIIIEISSCAVINRYVESINLDIAIFTNLKLKNIKEKEEYINSKIEIFKRLKSGSKAIINKKDKYYEYFTFPSNTNIYYGSSDSSYYPKNIKLNYDNAQFKIGEKIVKLKLIGISNVYNYLAAYTLIKSLGFKEEEIINISSDIEQVDGRYQGVFFKERLVIIDYAYTPDMIKNIIKTTKKISKGKIYTLVGAGGNRRVDSRNKIGKTVTKNSYYAIFTTDNPRDETPEKIIEDIVKDLKETNFEIILDRKEAIKKAISLLNKNDILLILGKGNEEYQIIGEDKFPHSDIKEVQKNIRK